MKMTGLLIAVVLLPGFLAPLWAHDIKGERFLYDGARFLVNGEMLEGENLYEPAIARAGNRVYVAMLEFTPGEGDRIVVAEWKDGNLHDQRTIPGAAGQFRKPTLTVDSTDHLWLSYEVLVDDHWQVHVQRSKAHTLFAGAAHVIAEGGSNINHEAVAMADGTLGFVWQGETNGQWDVKFRTFDGKGNFGEVETLSENKRLGDWHPAIAASSDGTRMTAVWDAYDGDSFSVRARQFDGKRWGKPFAVTDSRAFEGRADVVYDRGNRVFISWEEGSVNWGKEYRGALKDGDKLNDEYGPMHRFRLVRIAEIAEDGAVSPVSFPMQTFEAAANREGAVVNRERLGVFYERPRLTIDEINRLWVVYRHYYYPEVARPGRPKSHVEEGWRLYGRCLADNKWSEVIGLEPNQRDGMQRLAVLPEADGFSALWTTGRTHRGEKRGPRGVSVARINGVDDFAFAVPPDTPGAATKLVTEKSQGKDQPDPGFAPEGVAGEQFHLFLGDLHRHTDLSLCRVYFDGTMDDAYRYAIEAGGLDFLGITDHCRDIANGDAQSQLWWRSIKEVTRHRLSEKFFPMFAFERSHGETDHNVISLRDDMLRPYQPPLKEFWDLIDTDTFTIPHNPIRPLRAFAFHDDVKRPLLEIYQGCRDNPMTAQAHDGLGRGYHMGFIGSSDHMATRTSYACVWSSEPGAEAIFRSMQARRTYGATDRIRLVFRSEAHWMGEIVKVESMPMFQFEVDGTAPIERVEVIRNGEVVETFRNEIEGEAGKRIAGEFRGQGSLEDDPWFYVHVVQVDGEQAWSSPIWLESQD